MSPLLPFPRLAPQTNTPARRWVVTPKGIGDYGSQDERHLPVLLSLLLQGPSHQHHMLLWRGQGSWVLTTANPPWDAKLVKIWLAMGR